MRRPQRAHDVCGMAEELRHGGKHAWLVGARRVLLRGVDGTKRRAFIGERSVGLASIITLRDA